MTGVQVSRRSFLALTGGAVLLVACGSDDSTSGAGSDGTDTSGASSGDAAAVQAGVVSSDLHVSNDPQRLALAALSLEGQVSGAPMSVAIAPPGGELGEFMPTTLRADGLPENRAIYTSAPVLDVEGVWDARIDYGGEESDFVFQVNPNPVAPVAGADAIVTPSATLADPLGVDPICTLSPQCPYHEKSLTDVLGAGKPVVIQFSTPARCQTQYCGPVLQTFVDLAGPYENDVEMVHVEIYPDSRSPEPVDAVLAWGLATEPWMYGVDASGTIVARLDGAFDATEMTEMLDQLVS